MDQQMYWRYSITWRFEPPDELDLYAWTSPVELLCGDLIVLYEGDRKNRQAVVAIGRAVTDSVRAYLGDKRHWAWIQFAALATPIPLETLRDLGLTKFESAHVGLDPEVGQCVWRTATRQNSVAKKTWADWAAGHGFPTTDLISLKDLVKSRWDVGVPTEVRYYEPIEDALLAEGYREVPDPPVVELRRMYGATPTDPRANRLRMPDILVERSGRRRELVVVEVKRRATHRENHDFDPVAQVLNYVDVAKRLDGAVRGRYRSIVPMLVALDFDAAELRHARAAGVECRQFRPAERSLVVISA